VRPRKVVDLPHIILLFPVFRIIAVLSPEERGLFRERIRSLDKKIHPGLTKLTWASKGISDYFIGECRNNCSKVRGGFKFVDFLVKGVLFGS